MKYYYLYIPAVVFFLLPLLRGLYVASIARREAREKEAKRAAAAAAKEAAEQERKARQEARAAAADPAQEPKRKRGRPRKNPPPEQSPEIILPEEASAPVQEEPPAVQEEPPAVQIMTIQRASVFPDIDKMEPPCTPEEFADRIR